MDTHRTLALATMLALVALIAIPALAAPPEPAANAPSTGSSALSASNCRLTTGERIDLAQGMPIDCCKGHKGICGCRAGKIVCCDGSVSKDPNCTCHSDWGVEN